MITPQDPNSDIHYCTSYREDSWIIWICPICKSYERRFNWETGEMIVEKGNFDAQHVGFSDKGQNLEGLIMNFEEN